MNHKHRAVVSSYSDLSKISSNIKIIHFRKFISRRILNIILEKCPNIKIISLSKCASKRLNYRLSQDILKRGISIKVSENNSGKPSLIEEMVMRKKWFDYDEDKMP